MKRRVRDPHDPEVHQAVLERIFKALENSQ